MANRSPEREEFLGDIITGAVEGGTGYWAQVLAYQYTWDGERKVYCGRKFLDPNVSTMAILVAEDDEDGKQLRLDPDVIAKAFTRMREGSVPHLNDRTRARLLGIDATNDGGEIDADDADVIVQVALFGEVVYG